MFIWKVERRGREGIKIVKSKCSYYCNFIYIFVYFYRVGCHGSRIARLNGMCVMCITLNLYMQWYAFLV